MTEFILPKVPLAERMRPANLDEFVGQEKLLSSKSLLRRMIDGDELASFVLWGPPGVGKTTLARLIAGKTKAMWTSFSAVTSGIKEIKDVMAEAKTAFHHQGVKTVLFIDEIHRFNKAQQDAFLPHVENGTILLIGATTENPSFELNQALLSRLKVFVMEELSITSIVEILKRALSDVVRGLGNESLQLDDEMLTLLAVNCSGDARIALNSLELLAIRERTAGNKNITAETIQEAVRQGTLKYDKAGENHYNLISALHKSIRNSDADAAIYWLARMLEAGEDPLYIARRLVVVASEDIGLAHPQALSQAVAAMQAITLIGMPEGKLALTQAVVYLSYAPKSNAIYKAYMTAMHDVLNTLQYPVPFHLRNAPTKLMQELGYGQGYKYAHDYAEGKANMQCLPQELCGVKYYQPTTRGFEGKLKLKTDLHG